MKSLIKGTSDFVHTVFKRDQSDHESEEKSLICKIFEILKQNFWCCLGFRCRDSERRSHSVDI